MKFLLFAASTVLAVDQQSLLEVERMLAVDPHNEALEEARREEVSFLESTLHSMQHNQEAVINSNKALQDLLNNSEQRLHGVASKVEQMNRETREQLGSAKPFSLLQTNAKSMFDGDDSTPLLARAGPKSALEAARARAAASEKKFQEAMKKLEADKEALIKDENMRRARAAQERRHIHI
jgi:hypothetical protein